MKIDFIQEYGTRLFHRRDSGVIPVRLNVGIGEWRPREKLCHENVSLWTEHDQTCRPVRGWIYFDFCYGLPCVRFTAHSVIHLSDGTLRDITPAQTFKAYPFIQAEESEDEYANLIEAGIQYFEYELATGKVFVNGYPEN